MLCREKRKGKKILSLNRGYLPKVEVWEKKIVTMINKIYVAEFNNQTQLSIIVPANTPWAVNVLVYMYFRFFTE